MKIYLSLPISRLPSEQVKSTAAAYKEQLSSEGHTVTTPFDVCPDPAMPYAQCMGRDIEALLECDVVFLCPGWVYSKGCRLEWNAALIYGKEIWDADDLSTAKIRMS